MLKMTSVTTSESHVLSSSDVDNCQENSAMCLPNHEDAEPKHEFSDEEVRNTLEVIASTGKFWHDWDNLKEMMSFQLKKVLAEYPKSQTTTDVIGPQWSSLSGETFNELEKRLDEALLSFVEGPPFTLQRLCEILLNPRSIYSNLSKLALALEKNLLVTSTLSVCTDPYPPAAMQKPDEYEEVGNIAPQADPNVNENGTDAMVICDGDVEMAEPEADEASSRHLQSGMESEEGNICGRPENRPGLPTSEPSADASPSSEQQSGACG